MLFRLKSNKTKTVFVTGGSGFLGRNLIRGLQDAGYAVRALARSSTAGDTIGELGAEIARGDVLDEQALTTAMDGCWAVIHAAANTDHADGGEEQERVNVEGTRTVFRAARNAGVTRGLHISTEAVLANGNPIHMADETWPIPSRLAGNYSRTKAQAEQAALAMSGNGLEICAIRPRFLWGRDDTSALPQIEQAARDGRLRWIGKTDYRTSTTHVANAVTGAIAALERGRAGQPYFISDGEPRSFRDFISSLLSVRAITPPGPDYIVPRWAVRLAVFIGPWLERISFQKIKPPISRQEYVTFAYEVTINDTLARRELGYEPVITVDAGLEEIRSNDNPKRANGRR